MESARIFNARGAGRDAGRKKAVPVCGVANSGRRVIAVPVDVERKRSYPRAIYIGERGGVVHISRVQDLPKLSLDAAPIIYAGV